MDFEKELIEGVFGRQGYLHAKELLSDGELADLRAFIEDQYLEVIREQYPELWEDCKRARIAQYHEAGRRIDHKKTWPKLRRIFSAAVASKVKAMPFFKKLESVLGSLAISTEENVGWEEIYWRLVRPEAQEDVGPLHADKWFWELGYGTTPADSTRIKLWFPIFAEPGKNGLLMAPGSHRENWPYEKEVRDGLVKPNIVIGDRAPNAVLIPANPLDVLIFNDTMIHGGAVNHGERTRVSLEFTIFAKTERLEGLKKTHLH